MISHAPLRTGKEAATAMKAAIVAIGDEVVLGENLDTNTAWLAAQLAERSIATIEHRTIGDDRAAIAAAIIELTGRVDVILMTGGLGPTDDDLTRDALNDVINPGQELVTDAEMKAVLEARFARQGRTMPQSNLRQATRPASMRPLVNPNGTAPGLMGTAGSCKIVAMPGPPREMKPMFLDHVAPELSSQNDGSAMVVGLVHAVGLGESDAAERLGSLMDRNRHPLIGTTVSDCIVTARIRACGPVDAVREQLQQDMQRVQQAWEPYVFGTDGITLAQSIGKLLRESGRTLVTAESCTGGLLGKMLVDVPGSTEYYLGGWITYANDMKTSSLAVSHELLEAHGAVSAEVAEAMVAGAMANAEADCALAITGVAGPGGGTPQKPVGTVFISIAQMHNSLLNVSTRHFVFPGDRMTVRDRSAKAALQMLRFALLDVPDETPLLWQVPSSSIAARKQLR